MQTVNEVRTAWVEALRSGQYRQGNGCLRHRTADGGDEFCCLGVLADVVQPDAWEEDPVPGPIGHGEEHYEGIPDEAVLKRAGISVAEAEGLARMNDSGVPFAEIAECIEECG